MLCESCAGLQGLTQISRGEVLRHHRPVSENKSLYKIQNNASYIEYSCKLHEHTEHMTQKICKKSSKTWPKACFPWVERPRAESVSLCATGTHSLRWALQTTSVDLGQSYGDTLWCRGLCPMDKMNETLVDFVFSPPGLGPKNLSNTPYGETTNFFSVSSAESTRCCYR